LRRGHSEGEAGAFHTRRRLRLGNASGPRSAARHDAQQALDALVTRRPQLLEMLQAEKNCVARFAREATLGAAA
jgi:hypothetical protein